MALSADGLKRVARELKELSDKPEDGIRVVVNEDNVADVQADIEGPTGTPYQGGLFRLRLHLPPDFPASPPTASFATKVFHPNVSTGGAVCVSVLKKDWAPTLGLRHVLAVIRCLLIQPFPDSALNEEAGRLLHEDYAAFASRAALLTSVHAAPPPPPAAAAAAAAGAAAARPATGPLTASGGANAVNAGGEEGAGAGAAGAGGRVSGDGDKKARPPPGGAAGGRGAGAAAKKRSLKRL